MKKRIITIFSALAIILLISIIAVSKENNKTNKKQQNQFSIEKLMSYRELTPEEQYVIINKGTEKPFTGKFNDHNEKGVYTCRQCGTALYISDSKFKSECGWPSFDDSIPDKVLEQPDADGYRVEILCNNCKGHLGHVFRGEGFTQKNTRHCVNSISMDFIPESKYEKAVFASGCFWGVQYQLQKMKGIIYSIVGYTGGNIANPTYKQVCTGLTGHAEAIEIAFDPNQLNYEELAKMYFETHDPTQVNGQGPDIGEQYRSEIFYTSENQKETAENLIRVLRDKGLNVVTRLTPATTFWPAEDYHQNYYIKTGKQPYCHAYQKRFDDKD